MTIYLWSGNIAMINRRKNKIIKKSVKSELPLLFASFPLITTMYDVVVVLLVLDL